MHVIDHPVAFDEATFLTYGYPVPPEAVLEAKHAAYAVKFADEIRQHKSEPDPVTGEVWSQEDLDDERDQTIQWMDQHFPHWVDEVNGFGYYEQTPSAVLWRWAESPPKGKRKKVKREDETHPEGTTVRAAGYTPDEIKAKIVAHVTLAAEQDPPAPLSGRGLYAEVKGSRAVFDPALRELIAEGRLEVRPGPQGAKLLWPSGGEAP